MLRIAVATVRMMTFLSGILLLAAMPGTAQAPVSIPFDRSAWIEIAEQGLATDDPPEAAWGAWLAGRLELAELVPDLVAFLLAEHPEDEKRHSPWQYARGNAVDALIRLDAPLPPAALALAWEVDRAAALVLAARESERHGEFLLDLLDGQLDDAEWVLLHELLLAARPREITASLLARARIGVDVVVHDTDRRSRIHHSGSMNNSRNTSGSVPTPVGYPPGTAYRLSLRAEPGCVVVTGGVRPVYFDRRTFAPGEGHGWGRGVVSMPRHKDNLAYLHRLAGVGHGEEDALRIEATRNARFADDAGFLAAVAEERAAHRERVSRLLGRLRKRGLLDAEATADDVLALEVRVHDKRVRPHPPLPSVAD